MEKFNLKYKGSKMKQKMKFIESHKMLEEELVNLVRDCYEASEIFNILSNESRYKILVPAFYTGEKLNLKALEDKINDHCSNNESYKRIQEILRNKLIFPTNRKDYLLYNEDNQKLIVIKKEILQMDFKYPSQYASRGKVLPVIYNPKLERGFVNFKDENSFNKYNMPNWKKGLTTFPNTELPEIYKRFLKHFTDGDTESIEYILDWMAISVQNKMKNKTYLTAIGAQGIGKGVLSSIITQLHGEDNSSELRFNSIRKQFNKPFVDRTFIFLDEVIKASDEEMNNLKRLESDIMEAELKGVDAETVPNFNNIYIASNNLDSLRIEADDRRLGIVNIGKTKLEKTFTQDEIVSMKENQENIKNLGFYLMNREINPNSRTVGYKSKNALNILNNTTSDWEKYMIDDFCKVFDNKVIAISEVIKHIKRYYNKSYITITSLKHLSKRYSGVFEPLRTNKYMYFNEMGLELENLLTTKDDNIKRLECIKILPVDKQKNYELIEGEG
jgi:Family of unknown function (DUF5906)